MVMHQTSFFSSKACDQDVHCLAPFSRRGNRVLATALKKDPYIKSIKVGQKNIKITQHPDDTTVLVPDLDESQIY